MERGALQVKNMEFCKKILVADYAILVLMIVFFFIFTMKGHDTSNCAVVVGAWVAQIAISSGFYFWKAKAENLVKLPLYMLDNLSEDMKEKADPNQIIETIIGMGRN